MKKHLIKKEEGLKMIGTHTFKVASIETPEQKALHAYIEELRTGGKPYIEYVRKLNAMCRVKEFVVPNIITTAGKTMVANNFAYETPDNELKFNYTALGSGVTTPNVSQTQLVAETYRRQTASIDNDEAEVLLTAFYSAAEVTGTFYEHAIFSNGTGSANTGVMFSRVLINNSFGITKSASESLTIDYTLTIE